MKEIFKDAFELFFEVFIDLALAGLIVFVLAICGMFALKFFVVVNDFLF